MFERRRTRKSVSEVDKWLSHARNGDLVHVCDDVPERPPGDRRISAVNVRVVESRYRTSKVSVVIRLDGDEHWWAPDQLHVREL